MVEGISHRRGEAVTAWKDGRVSIRLSAFLAVDWENWMCCLKDYSIMESFRPLCLRKSMSCS